MEVPHEFTSRRGSSALWHGALFSLSSLSEETLNRRDGPVYRRVTPYARKRTHFTSRKEQGEIPVKWSDSQTYTETDVWCRPIVVHLRRLYITVCSLRTTSTRHLNMPYERKKYYLSYLSKTIVTRHNLIVFSITLSHNHNECMHIWFKYRYQYCLTYLRTHARNHDAPV